MAKISKAQGPSMTTVEYEGAENLQPDVVIRRPEIGPMRRVRKGEEPSVGTKSSRSTEDKAKQGSNVTKSPQGPVPSTENPSGQEPGIHSTVVSADGTVQQTENQPFVDGGSEPPEAEKKATPRATKAQGRKTPQKRAKAPAGAEDETVPDPDKAGVRFTDDDF